MYPGIYSSQKAVHSLYIKNIMLPRDLNDIHTFNTLSPWKGKNLIPTLTFFLMKKRNGHRCANDPQGTRSDQLVRSCAWSTVVIVETDAVNLQLHNSVSHVVVTMSRHNDSYIYCQPPLFLHLFFIKFLFFTFRCHVVSI